MEARRQEKEKKKKRKKREAARNVEKMKDSGKWRAKKRAGRRRKDALGLREEGREREG